MERRNQPPLVHTSTCSCRVDVGLKTITEASKFVPGSKHCIQTSVEPYVDPTRKKASKGNRSRRRHCRLLPGLPDDLAIACLIRVPRAEHRKLRLVCKRWHGLLAGNYFYSLRKNLGIAEEWLYIIKRDREGQISWDAFDPLYQVWHPVPPIPADYSKAIGFGCAVLSDCHLFLVGGKDPVKGSMRRVIFYSARTNKWHRAPDMLRRRHLFGTCVIQNCLYIAGGESAEGALFCSLRSAEMYDPNKNCWSFTAEMSTSMVPFIGVVYDGRWFLKGLGPHQQVVNQVYCPETDGWYAISNGMVAGWRSPSVCLDGKLYAMDCKDGCRLRDYDETSDSWSGQIDSKKHLGSSQAMEAAALIPLKGKLCVVRNNMSITLVDVCGNNGWETIAGKGHLRTFITNLWSNIAGRTGSHIVHCQVLHA